MASIREGGRLLAELSGSELRAYSTYDFGRQRDPDAVSVVVPNHRARGVLSELRRRLGSGLVCFMGTTRWLGDEQHTSEQEIVLASGGDQFDILRIARSDAVNYDMETEDLVEKLREYHRRFGIDITYAETDTIGFDLVELPEDLSGFAKDLYEFCPDVVDQGVGDLARLERVIGRHEGVFLWWD